MATTNLSALRNKKMKSLMYATLVVSCCSFGAKGSPGRILSTRARSDKSTTRTSLTSRRKDEPLSNQRTEEIDLVRLNISDGIASDETVIYFVDGGSDTFDADYDARKISNGSLEISSYCYTAKVSMAINGISNTLDTYIPIKIGARNSNVCTLRFSEYVNASNRQLYIYDNINQTYTLIKEGGIMDLGGNLKNCLGRFFLTSTTANIITGFENVPLSQSNISISPNPYNSGPLKVKMNSIEANALKIEISDTQGNLFKSLTQNDISFSSDSDFDLENQVKDLPAGTYILKVFGQNSVLQQKLIITN